MRRDCHLSGVKICGIDVKSECSKLSVQPLNIFLTICQSNFLLNSTGNIREQRPELRVGKGVLMKTFVSIKTLPLMKILSRNGDFTAEMKSLVKVIQRASFRSHILVNLQ
jgi:hypothetical protein